MTTLDEKNLTNDDLGCEFCGRIVLAGICCDQAYHKACADWKAHVNSPEYQAQQKQEMAIFKQAKAERRQAKRQRRFDRMTALPWDIQDQTRVETSEWEGMTSHFPP